MVIFPVDLLGSSVGSRLQAFVKRVLRPSFAAAGLRPGDRVAALLPNGPEVTAVFQRQLLKTLLIFL